MVMITLNTILGARKDPTMNAMAPMVVGHEQSIADYLSKQ